MNRTNHTYRRLSYSIALALMVGLAGPAAAETGGKHADHEEPKAGHEEKEAGHEDHQAMKRRRPATRTMRAMKRRRLATKTMRAKAKKTVIKATKRRVPMPSISPTSNSTR